MLHIILMILKIIGIIILSVLGLLLLGLLVVLFMPVIYRIKASKHDEDMQGFAKVSWLFVSAKASMDNKNKKFELMIRIFGIPLEVFQKIGRAICKVCKRVMSIFRKKKKSEIADQVRNDEGKARGDEKNNSVGESLDPPAQKSPNEANSTEASLDPPAQKSPNEANSTGESLDLLAQKSSNETNNEDADTSKEGLWNRLKAISIKIYYFPQWLYEQVRKIWLTISEFCGKIKQWRDFFCGNAFKRAVRFVLNKGGALIKHIMPRKITGNVTYGLEDPATTGQILAVLSVVIPMYKGKFQVVPMFNQKILEGDIYIKGHILGFTLVKIAWSVYRNKDVKEVINHFRKREA